MHRSSRLCSLLSVEQLIIFEEINQSLSTCAFYSVFSLILNEPHTNQIWESSYEEEPSYTRILYIPPSLNDYEVPNFPRSFLVPLKKSTQSKT